MPILKNLWVTQSILELHQYLELAARALSIIANTSWLTYSLQRQHLPCSLTRSNWLQSVQKMYRLTYRPSQLVPRRHWSDANCFAVLYGERDRRLLSRSDNVKERYNQNFVSEVTNLAERTTELIMIYTNRFLSACKWFSFRFFQELLSVAYRIFEVALQNYYKRKTARCKQENSQNLHFFHSVENQWVTGFQWNAPWFDRILWFSRILWWALERCECHVQRKNHGLVPYHGPHMSQDSNDLWEFYKGRKRNWSRVSVSYIIYWKVVRAPGNDPGSAS